jgi:hypothetical protein
MYRIWGPVVGEAKWGEWRSGTTGQNWDQGKDCPHLLLTVTTCSLRGHLSGPLAQLLVSPGAGLR